MNKAKSAAAASGTSFDHRDVRYEEIHSIRDEDFEAMVRMAKIEDGMRILDCGCGYGACAREFLMRLDKKHSMEIDLLDRSEAQLGRSSTELAAWENDQRVVLRRIRANFPDAPSPAVRYDRIVAKMMLHESPAHIQPGLLRAMRDHLRPYGIVIIWDLFLTPNTAGFFRQIIRWKDELVGNNTFVRDRYLPTAIELHEWLEAACLSIIGEPRVFDYQIDTGKRLATEFGNNHGGYNEWMSRIRTAIEALPLAIRDELRIDDNGHSIRFRVSKAIIAASVK